MEFQHEGVIRTILIIFALRQMLADHSPVNPLLQPFAIALLGRLGPQGSIYRLEKDLLETSKVKVPQLHLKCQA